MNPAQPDAWHVAYAVHGLDPRRQPPIPASEYGQALRWLAEVWSVEVVAKGLRLAVSISGSAHSGVRPSVLEALADAWTARAQREVAA